MKTQLHAKSLSDLAFEVAAAKDTTTHRRVAGSGYEPDAPLRVLIAYEDFATDQRAMKLCSKLIVQIGREYQFRTCFWKFDILRVPRLKTIAAHDAGDADVVLISTHGSGELPAAVKSWMAAWAGKKSSGAKSLVALLDGPDEWGQDESPVNSYLKAFAEKSRIGFFSHTTALPRNDLEFSPDGIAAAQAALVPLTEVMDQPVRSCRWGINE
jgi:hypothetical protein